MPLISVIIPTYNRLATLPRALNSIAEQVFTDYEIIVVDDGSTDNTQSWLQQHYPNIKYYYQQQQGVSCARNKGITCAQGKWIALLDSDDTWHPEKLLDQLKTINKTNHLICHTNEIWIRNGVRVNPMQKHQKYDGDIYHHCLPRCCISPSSVLIHRDVFKHCGMFDQSLPACEDYDLWLRICARYPVSLIRSALTTKYGGHQDQLSSKYWGMNRFRVRALHKILSQDILTISQQEATRHMLLTKLHILKNGAIKHGNRQLLEELTDIEDQVG